MSLDLKNQLPIKRPKKIRESCPEKRGYYKKYDAASYKWEDVFLEIERLKKNGEKNFLKIIETDYDIPYGTIRTKYSNWIKNDKKINENDNRGGHNKLFTDQQEKTIYEIIKNVFIDCHLYCDDDIIRIIANLNWIRLNPENKSDFMVSKGWIYYFKKRWKLSSITAKYLHITKNRSVAEIIAYLKSCQTIFANLDDCLIFNMDETFWRINNGNIQITGITGTNDRKLLVGKSPKTGFTIVFIASANGTLMKPLIIFKGSTMRVFNKISDISDDLVYKKYSTTGWMNSNVMSFILEEINKKTNGRKSALILDQHRSHLTDTVKNLASKYNIELIYVPKGETAKHQPLDVSINGIIKAKGKYFLKELFMEDAFRKITESDAINCMLKAKNTVTCETIKKAFNIACDIKSELKEE